MVSLNIECKAEDERENVLRFVPDSCSLPETSLRIISKHVTSIQGAGSIQLYSLSGLVQTPNTSTVLYRLGKRQKDLSLLSRRLQKLPRWKLPGSCVEAACGCWQRCSSGSLLGRTSTLSGTDSCAAWSLLSRGSPSR